MSGPVGGDERSPDRAEAESSVPGLLANLEEAVTAARAAKAQIRPESVSEPDAPTTAPEASESHSGEIPPLSDDVCPCGDTGVLNGSGCFGCELGQTVCRFCGSDAFPRAFDSQGRAACVDEEACAVRDAGPAAPAPSEIGNHETPGWDAPAPKDDTPDTACQLCGSTKALTVYVTDGRLGSDDEGVWRCAAASDCKRRIALKGAREKITE